MGYIPVLTLEGLANKKCVWKLASKLSVAFVDSGVIVLMDLILLRINTKPLERARIK